VNKRTTNDAQSQPDAILPPWAIAVAVLGVVSVVIVLLLGASVVMKYKNELYDFYCFASTPIND
jgi:hypothetical protein